MNIIKIDKDNLINGAGNRCVVWLSGCSWNCPGCQNPETHDCNLGDKYNEEHKKIIDKQLRSKRIDGITFTGGDPLYLSNREELLELLKYIKITYPKKSIWMWTGYKFEDIKDLEHLRYIDVLIDGKFDINEKPKRKVLRYRGSRNQRVIDVQETLFKNKICYWKDFDGWDSSREK